MRVRVSRWTAAVGSALLIVTVAGATTAGTTATAAISPTAVLIHPDEVYAGTVSSGPPTLAQCEANFKVACYGPIQIEKAYDLPPLYASGITGKGQTIVIVDSYGSPTIGHDLAVFDKAYGLPAPPSFTVIQPAGPVPLYQADPSREGWAGETNLDVEYSHAIAPDANILLVETPTSENEGTTGFPQIVQAEEYVIDHHLGGVISQSFSATENTFPSTQSLLALRGAYTDAAANNVTVLAASGDSGAADVRTHGAYYDIPVTSWPDSDPAGDRGGGHPAPARRQGRPHRPRRRLERHLQRSHPAIHLRQPRSEPSGRWRWPLHHLPPALLPGRGEVGRGQHPGRA